jgi:integrase
VFTDPGQDQLSIARAADVRVLPSPQTMVAVIDAIPSHQPESQICQVMTAVAYFSGLRLSEVVMLRPRALYLSATGWGSIEVVEADIDWDEPGEPKTDEWIEERALGDDDLLFRTRNDRRPAPSNWSRTLHRAYRTVGHPPLRVYDCRHAPATTWLGAGVPWGEVARRLGHSVRDAGFDLRGALQGDDTAAAACASSSPPIP